jgi:hypothetical protein
MAAHSEKKKRELGHIESMDEKEYKKDERCFFL